MMKAIANILFAAAVAYGWLVLYYRADEASQRCSLLEVREASMLIRLTAAEQELADVAHLRERLASIETQFCGGGE